MSPSDLNNQSFSWNAKTDLNSVTPNTFVAFIARAHLSSEIQPCTM